MIHALATMILNAFHLIGFFVLLYGVCVLLASILSFKGADGYFRGGVAVVIGTIISHLGQ